jgi:cell fate regulator YaaT (PSP1 superfamily)
VNTWELIDAAMHATAYLLSFGANGELGRFDAPSGLVCRRRQRVVAQSRRGLELATVLRPADGDVPDLLPSAPGGAIVRLATADDEDLALRLKEQAGTIFEDARTQATEQSLPIDVLDVEVLLDARQAVLHYVAWGICDPRHLMEVLSDRHRLLITLNDLAPKPATGTCGSGGCGSGGCGSCGTDGCGHCAEHEPAAGRVSLV